MFTLGSERTQLQPGDVIVIFPFKPASMRIERSRKPLEWTSDMMPAWVGKTQLDLTGMCSKREHAVAIAQLIAASAGYGAKKPRELPTEDSEACLRFKVVVRP
jgi:hypothetical protein